jgi:precorrin-6Y C5,15-methyltransferase (decarboxylating)
MSFIHVVGIGLDGAAGLTETVRQHLDKASLLVGSDRHLSYFPTHSAERLFLSDLTSALQMIQQRLALGVSPEAPIVVLASGDPLFFGLGRLLLAELPADELIFHPHLSAVQLAFSRVKLPWQDARVISAHGRSFEELILALQQGVEKIAVLTDATHTPAAIARLLLGSHLPQRYQCWVCENLGGDDEQIQFFPIETLGTLTEKSFAPLNVVVLQQSLPKAQAFDQTKLPMLGLPDHSFLCFPDQPGLMTKREVRVLVLGELALQPGQRVWDIGAGTGSVAIEIARLFPTSTIYAIEKNVTGLTLIHQNCQRFQTDNVWIKQGQAPDVLTSLPDPDRVFIGGSSGQLSQILTVSTQRLQPGGVIVIALATLEHLNIAMTWLQQKTQATDGWNYHILQVQLARSLPIGHLTRLSPLNPITIITMQLHD